MPNKSKFKHAPRGLEILFEDRDIIVVNKEAGLLTEATRRKELYTAENVINDYIRKGQLASKKHVWLVHRLDRDTSGVLIFAKSQEIREALQATWDDVTKIYIARVHGRLREKSGTLTGYLYEDEDLFMRQTQDPKMGKFARTDFEVTQEYQDSSLLKVQIHTGRKNQIRVQFACIAHPIVGDTKYGRDPKSCKTRLCLHAKSIDFMHPVTGKRMHFETDTPPELLL